MSANGAPNLNFDQYQETLGACSVVYLKCMQICDEKGYTYFVIRNLKFTDENGLTIELSGPEGLDADLIQESLEGEDLFPGSKADFGIYWALLKNSPIRTC